ncbi:MAG: ribose 5-phosphate isomerase B [Candidatus Aenigmarchaeota archaeon]|nr:ribose 5-phosphate isomerase B [Candidatus Aenigmarchaeota archaeon]
MRIALGSDHAGFPLKKDIRKYLDSSGLQFHDFGTYSTESVDYPDYAAMVAESVRRNEYERGILVCGTGIGMCIAANKFQGIRAALCYNSETARLSREHNDANVLVLGGRMTNEDDAKEMIKVWLETDFAGERHLRRIGKISKLEKRYGRDMVEIEDY